MHDTSGKIAAHVNHPVSRAEVFQTAGIDSVSILNSIK